MSRTTIRTAIATVITTAGYRVSDVADVADMMGTDSLAAVAVEVGDGPSDQWDGTRTYVATLRAFALRGSSEARARTSLEVVARTLRAGMLAQGALAAASAQVIEGTEEVSATPDAVLLTQTHTIQATA
jgi:hypothetical protein